MNGKLESRSRQAIAVTSVRVVAARVLLKLASLVLRRQPPHGPMSTAAPQEGLELHRPGSRAVAEAAGDEAGSSSPGSSTRDPPPLDRRALLCLLAQHLSR